MLYGAVFSVNEGYRQMQIFLGSVLENNPMLMLSEKSYVNLSLEKYIISLESNQNCIVL